MVAGPQVPLGTVRHFEEHVGSYGAVAVVDLLKQEPGSQERKLSEAYRDATHSAAKLPFSAPAREEQAPLLQYHSWDYAAESGDFNTGKVATLMS